MTALFFARSIAVAASGQPARSDARRPWLRLTKQATVDYH
jgi:hypothetical protein